MRSRPQALDVDQPALDRVADQLRARRHCQLLLDVGPVGLHGADAQVQLPDIQMTGLVPGAVIRVEGSTVARLTGGDYAAIRAVVSGERVTPLGQWTDWIAGQARAGKPAEGKAA